MWARVMEFMLALWLAASQFVFDYAPSEHWLRANDLVCAALVGLFALGSFHRRLRRLHLGELLVAAWLLGVGVSAAGDPPAPAYQNYTVFALLLAMIAVVPSRCDHPPASWRAYYDRRESLSIDR